MSDLPDQRRKAASRPLLERPDLKPEERVRIGRAVVVLLGWGLIAIAVLGILTLWHLIRRGRVLRASLPEPRAVSLLEMDRNELDPSDRLSGSNGIT